jgi:protein SCO1/2
MRRAYAIGVAAALGLGVALGVLLHSTLWGTASAGPPRVPSLQGQITWRARSRPAPAFELRDQNGRLVALRGLRGRSVVLTFQDSRCKSECPIEGRMLAAAIRQLAPAVRPRVVVVSVNPWGDTPASARRALRQWGLPANVSWLLGTKAQLASVWRAYGVSVIPTKADVTHTAVLYVIDRQGDERAGFLVPFLPISIAHDLRVLAAA